MHAEWGQIDEATAERLNAARAAGGRIIAVGTTTGRVLESAATLSPDNYHLSPLISRTRIFIHPPQSFRVVDALITNFHLPKSSLLFLVAALAGRKKILAAYQEAVTTGYRFFSYGDAMAIIQNRVGVIGCHPESEPSWYEKPHAYHARKHWHEWYHHHLLLQFVDRLIGR